MTREEILSKAKNNQKQNKEYEKYIIFNSDHFTVNIIGLICAIIIFANLIINHKLEYDICFIFFSIIGMQNLFDFIKNKKVLSIIISTFSIALSLFFIICYLVL